MSQYSQRVAASADDGYYAAEWFNNSSSNNVGYFGADVYAAWRWDNVNVPDGSTITSAYLKLTAYDTDSDSIVRKIYGFDEDDTATLTSAPGGRTKTTASTDWDISGQTANAVQTSPDISGIISEIMSRPGWNSGNAIGLITVDDGGTNFNALQHYAYDGDSSKAALLEINYNPPETLVTKSVTYRVRAEATPITKFGRYVITDPEDTAVPFVGLKIAKSGHNVFNTSKPDNLKFSSDYLTLKYFVDGNGSIAVAAGGFEFYTISGYIEHNLGYYPVAMVYAKDDDVMSNYVPLGYYTAGSGAYRQYSFYVTTTRLYIVADGYSESGVDYNLNFYYKIFKNKLTMS